MLFKLKHTLSIIFILSLLCSCQTRTATRGFRKPDSNKEQIKKDRERARRKKEYREYVEKKRNKHYNRQAESTKERWDQNKERAEEWNKKEFHNKSLSYRIHKFFERFEREPKPNNGLFSKRELRRKKGNIFKRVFKPKNKKKKKK